MKTRHFLVTVGERSGATRLPTVSDMHMELYVLARGWHFSRKVRAVSPEILADAARVDWQERHAECEVSHGGVGRPWYVLRQDWIEIARGTTWREAVDNAMKVLP